MLKTEWSKEPWSVERYSDMEAILLDADGSNHLVLWDYGHAYMPPEDADRIVACVNFCAGAPTDLLERMTNAGDTLGPLWENVNAD